MDESAHAGEEPAAYVERVARAKAEVIAGRHAGAVVVAADTAVVVDGEILGKPVDADDAVAILRRLSDRAHAVMTGLAVAVDNRMVADVVTTTVWFRPLRDDDIAWYVATGEPMDKAGAYGIQGIGGLFVDRIEGNHQNVVGLPLPHLADLLDSTGHPLGSFR